MMSVTWSRTPTAAGPPSAASGGTLSSRWMCLCGPSLPADGAPLPRVAAPSSSPPGGRPPTAPSAAVSAEASIRSAKSPFDQDIHRFSRLAVFRCHDRCRLCRAVAAAAGADGPAAPPPPPPRWAVAPGAPTSPPGSDAPRRGAGASPPDRDDDDDGGVDASAPAPRAVGVVLVDDVAGDVVTGGGTAAPAAGPLRSISSSEVMGTASISSPSAPTGAGAAPGLPRWPPSSTRERNGSAPPLRRPRSAAGPLVVRRSSSRTPPSVQWTMRWIAPSPCGPAGATPTSMRKPSPAAAAHAGDAPLAMTSRTRTSASPASSGASPPCPPAARRWASRRGTRSTLRAWTREAARRSTASRARPAPSPSTSSE